MAVDIGPKIGIEGEKTFRREITEINASLKAMASESKAVASSFDETTTAEEKYAKQADVINRQIEAQKNKLALLEKGLRDSAKIYGETDEKTQKWRQAVFDATKTLNDMEHGLDDLNKDVEENADSLKDAESAASGWADVMKGQLLADAIKGGLSKMAGWIKDGAKALWDASKAGAAFADDILTLSTTTGLSTDTLQEYKYMADLLDVSLETITGSMTKMEKKMAGAQKGTGAAAEAWKKLGVNITDSNGNLRDSEEIFNETVEALGKIEDETERDTVAMQLFGTSAKDLNPLIEAGADKLNDLAKQAHDTGYVLSGDALTALGKQQDAMDTFAKKTEAVSNAFAVSLAPTVTKVYDGLNETLENPRTQRALSVLSEGIGNVVSTLGDIALSALPVIVDAFGIFDSRIATFSDDQLERFAAMEDLAKSWDGLKKTFEEDAGAIWDEHEKANALWKKLQDITTETGEVKKGNEELAAYIINELNKDLGTNIEIIDGVVKGWQNVKKEIGDVITMQTAQALLAAGQDEYSAALANQEKAGKAAAATFKDLMAAQDELAAATAAHEESLRNIEEKYGDVAEAPLKVRQAYIEEGNAITTLQGKVDELQKGYEEQAALADDMMAKTDTYSKALAAQAEGDYQAVIDYTTKGYSLERDYIEKQGKLKEEEVLALKKKYDEQTAYVDFYEQQLAAKKAGYTEEGLKAAKKEQVRLLNAVSKGWTDIYNEATAQAKKSGKDAAHSYGDGLVLGLKDKNNEVYRSAIGIANQIKQGVTNTLQIKSPSRVADYIGQMWDAGLIRGLEAREEELAMAATGLAQTIEDNSTPSGAVSVGYGNALTATGGAGGTSSYTTNNMGGIAVYVNGAGAVNEQVLAQQIAEQLSYELQRTQRGGRA